MIERHTDATLMNRVLNDPAVRGDIADLSVGEIDLTPQAQNPNNVLLCGEHGGFFYGKLMPGIYEVHSAVLPSGRGKWAFAAAKASLDWIFTRTEAYEVLTRIPTGHGAAIGLATKCGLRAEYIEEQPGCVWRGSARPVEIWGIRMPDWIANTAAFDRQGEVFHVKLGELAAQAGITEPPHPDDPVHNRYVGSCMAMIEAGQAGKAVLWYNRWAQASRHPVVTLLSERPIEIAMDIGALRFNGADFELITGRLKWHDSGNLGMRPS